MTSPMRICIVGPIATENISHLLGDQETSAPAGYAGAPILATLIESLIDRGHEVIGITTDTTLKIGNGLVKLKGDRLQMIYCPQRRRAFFPEAGRLGRVADAFLLERRFLVEAIRETKPDVVHAHWLYEFAWAAQDAGFPHVLTAHDSPAQILKYTRNLYRAVRLLMARHVATRARHLTTVSPYMQKALAPMARVKVNLVPNPLPKHVISIAAPRIRSAEALTRTSPCLAMVFNGWSRWKNGESGLRAFALIQQALPDAQLHMFGLGTGEGGEAAQCAAANGITTGVRFFGPIPHEQLLQKLSTCDLLLHPSLEESFGAVLIEAMAQGVPVIGGRTSGAVPWVVGENGVLVDVTSPEAIAQAAIDLLRDPALLMAIGIEAQKRTLERFSPDAIASAYETQYQQARIEADYLHQKKS